MQKRLTNFIFVRYKSGFLFTKSQTNFPSSYRGFFVFEETVIKLCSEYDEFLSRETETEENGTTLPTDRVAFDRPKSS